MSWGSVLLWLLRRNSRATLFCIVSSPHVDEEVALQTTTLPVNIEIGKYYYKEHVEEITKEMNDALARGSAAAEEWSKGLEARGKQRMKVAEAWERWSVKHSDAKPAPSAVRSPAALPRKPSKSPKRLTVSPRHSRTRPSE